MVHLLYPAAHESPGALKTPLPHSRPLKLCGGGASVGTCLLSQEVILRCHWVESAGPRGSELGLLYWTNQF